MVLTLIFAITSTAFAADGNNAKTENIVGISPDITKEIGIWAERESERLSVPENRHQKWAQEKAEEFTAIYNSPEFQTRVQNETERLKREIFSQSIEKYSRDDRGSISIKGARESHLSKNERIYVFVSSSMPVQTIRNYAASIDKVSYPNIVMVMRGFINGMDDINSTMAFVSRALARDANCENGDSPCAMMNANLEIDPLLFKKYEIQEVPTIVYASNVQVLNAGGSEGIEKNATVGKFYRIMGDAALDYHLETINKEAHTRSLQELVEKMRKGFYP